MKLGKHAPSLEKCLEVIAKFNKVQQQIDTECDPKKLEHLCNQTHYTSYAVALAVVQQQGE